MYLCFKYSTSSLYYSSFIEFGPCPRYFPVFVLIWERKKMKRHSGLTKFCLSVKNIFRFSMQKSSSYCCTLCPHFVGKNMLCHLRQSQYWKRWQYKPCFFSLKLKEFFVTSLLITLGDVFVWRHYQYLCVTPLCDVDTNNLRVTSLLILIVTLLSITLCDVNINAYVSFLCVV